MEDEATRGKKRVRFGKRGAVVLAGIIGVVVLAAGLLGRSHEELPGVPRPPRYPIVLCHGLMGFDTIGVKGFVVAKYFRGIKEDLESVGCKVYVTRVSKSADVSVRARELKDQVAKYGTRVNIIAHSMGGLDARYLVSRLDGHKYVASITTISSPHRGSYYADWALKTLGKGLKVEAMLRRLGMDTAAFHNLTCEYMEKKFNPMTPDIPSVRYFSFGASQSRAKIFPPLLPSYEIILTHEGPNDGLVSVRSARWGEYLGTLDADHLDQINWNPVHDARPIYRKIVNVLASKQL